MGKPKSASGERAVVLSASLVEVLQKHRRKQVEWRLKIGEIYQDGGWVFADLEGKPIHPNTLARRFKQLLTKADVPRIRIHDLRHTHATFLMQQNVNPRIVQQRLGHSDVAMTLNRYSHVTTDMQQQAADQMDALMANEMQIVDGQEDAAGA